MATATKTTTVLRDWAEIGAAVKGTISLSSDGDVSTSFEAGVMVVVCPIEAVANALGALVTVEGRFGANDEDWRDLYTLRMGAGTAKTTDVDVESSGVTLSVTSTTDFEQAGTQFLVHDTVTPVNSELARTQTFDNDVSITLEDALKNTQPITSDIYDIVATKYFPIPPEVKTVRIILINDDDDCDVIWRADLTQMTAIG